MNPHDSHCKRHKHHKPCLGVQDQPLILLPIGRSSYMVLLKMGKSGQLLGAILRHVEESNNQLRKACVFEPV